ncbi:hypothetical protein JI749_04230 [Devosia oryziradicis]|jgi:hypothetical protein|uniref:Uncharacterized protein n=1 Tax=Devosia oryziradicis TaxID=2801335 RepID=A0ABX7BYG5_9HYPH|nr:hypothetical protein [Devosia oryziradicis]QQR36846.1 hypothetical protein JI749_04230 [Devosia oryziradicis]
MLKALTVTAITLAGIGGAMASSGDAWEEFAAEVEQGCLAATEGVFTEPSAVVDPFGSESFGLAIVSGEFPSGGQGSIICVFNKQTGAVEVGGELPVAVTPAE